MITFQHYRSFDVPPARCHFIGLVQDRTVYSMWYYCRWCLCMSFVCIYVGFLFVLVVLLVHLVLRYHFYLIARFDIFVQISLFFAFPWSL
jgi:hypothetical protein